MSATHCSRDKITSVFSWPLIACSRSPDFPKDFPNDGSLSPQMPNAQYHSHLHYVRIWHSAPKAPPIFPHPESDRSGIWELLGPECRVTSLTFPLLYCLLCLGSGSLALHNVYSCCHGGWVDLPCYASIPSNSIESTQPICNVVLGSVVRMVTESELLRTQPVTTNPTMRSCVTRSKHRILSVPWLMFWKGKFWSHLCYGARRHLSLSGRLEKL